MDYANRTMEERMKVVERYVSDTAFKGIRNTEEVEKLKARVKELESLTDRMQIALETTHSRLTNLETKVSQLERK